MDHMKNVIIRKQRCLTATIIFVIIGVLVLVVDRTSIPSPVSQNEYPPTAFKAPPLATEDDGKTHGHQGNQINSIPEHARFRYDLTDPTVTYPWKKDKECSRFAVRLGESLPPIFLYSYPRSGNSWTRYLMEGATGFFTGSVFHAKRLYNLGFLGEYENHLAGTTLFIKDHLFKGKMAFQVKKYPAVLLIRNPRTSIESFVSYKAGRGNLLYKGKQNDFRNLDARFKKDIALWEQVATQVLKNCQHLHVVVYENLKADPMNEVHNILKFVRMPEDPERLACLAKHAEGPLNRGQPEFDPFNAEQIAVMAVAVDRVNALMLQRGFSPLPFAKELQTSDD